MGSMMGMADMNADDMSGKLEDMMGTIRQVNEQFKNAVSNEKNTQAFLCCELLHVMDWNLEHYYFYLNLALHEIVGCNKY